MSIKKHLLFIPVYGLILFGCNSSTKTAENGYYFQDFDNLRMWSHDEQLSNSTAHSGSYSTYTDSMHEYSQTFEMDLDYAKTKGYKSVTVTAWCLMDSPSTNAGLVTSIDGEKGSVFYESVDLKSFLSGTNTWGKINKHFKLPDTATPGNKIKIYLWSPQKQRAYLDDVEIKFD